MNKDHFSWLQDWYSTYCGYCRKNININFYTVDNPGMRFIVNLENTPLQTADFVKVIYQAREEDDWTHCFIREGNFEGACGPRNLPQVLGLFRKWVEENLKPFNKFVDLAQKLNIPTEEENKNDIFLWLQNWYCYYCDGDWEHSNGFKIFTTEPFGWHVTIDLEMSELEGSTFESVTLQEREQGDWISCEVINNKFEGTCGPKRVCQLLSIFRKWAEGLGQKVNTTRTNFHDHPYRQW